MNQNEGFTGFSAARFKPSFEANVCYKGAAPPTSASSESASGFNSEGPILRFCGLESKPASPGVFNDRCFPPRGGIWPHKRGYDGSRFKRKLALSKSQLTSQMHERYPERLA